MFFAKIDRNPNIASSFWGGNYLRKRTSGNDVYLLASHKRAIANFVRIVTGKTIPVHFRTDDKSYTTGKEVTIGANIVEPKDFDVAVGLALHEASHIALSNFDLLYHLDHSIQEIVGLDEFRELLTRSRVRNLQMAPTIKNLWNWVEDRRIDEIIYSRAPGYRPYYQSMYNKYFWSADITKGLKSGSARTETLESYMFRIINIHNSATDLDALKKLREIWDTVDLKSIARLKTSDDALKVAISIYKLLLEALDEANAEEQEQSEGEQGEGGAGEGEAGDSSDSDSSDGDSSDGEADDSSDSDSSDGEAENFEGDIGDMKISEGDTGKETPKELSKTAQKNLEKAIQKQQDFLDGNVDKETVDGDTAKSIQVVESSGSEMKEVGGGSGDADTLIPRVGKTKCVVVKKLDQTYIDSDVFPLKTDGYSSSNKENNEEAVRKGIRLGRRMVGKLQTRSEERSTMYTRQRSGKIDKRMVNSLGYGNTSVFYVNEVDKFESANLHISVDASSSMDGSKWENAMTMAVALATAIEEIPNLDVQISFRAIISGSGHQWFPYVLMAYDSRVDKFTKIRKLFPQIYANGTTPEGLCFEAIMDEMVESSAGLKSYFLNLSDGQPYFSNNDVSYDRRNAPRHIKSIVNRMKDMGINILSYFVSDDATPESHDGQVFKECYGSAASFIDTENVTQIVKTMNELFMTKD